MELQKRILKNIVCESRETDGNEKIIEGFIPYDSPSERMFIGYADAEKEVITRTAFNKTLSDKRNVFLNYNHNSDLILAATKSGTMTLENKEDGLHFRANLPDTDIGNRAYQTIKRNDVNTLSFEFVPFDWEVKNETVYLRSCRLEAISVCVSSPAYAETECHTARNLKEQIRNLTRTIKQKRENEMDKETIEELKNLLTQILEALPKEERQEPETKEEPKTEEKEIEAEKKEETSEQPNDIQTEETDKSDEIEDSEVLEKIKELEKLKNELEQLQNA